MQIQNLLSHLPQIVFSTPRYRTSLLAPSASAFSLHHPPAPTLVNFSNSLFTLNNPFRTPHNPLTLLDKPRLPHYHAISSEIRVCLFRRAQLHPAEEVVVAVYTAGGLKSGFRHTAGADGVAGTSVFWGRAVADAAECC
ncbi:hypothetical protein KCU77_g116, partial [Aureobasidium melanogenum]